MKRDFLAIHDFTSKEVKEVFQLASRIKALSKKEQNPQILKNKHAALLFRKPSLRTRASFELSVQQFGGTTIFFSDSEIGMGKRESVSDVAKVLERFYHLIIIRTFDHKEIVDFAQACSVPVINALTDLEHPCQILGDIFTAFEHKGRWENLTIAYVGDGGNNIANSFVNAASRLSLDLRIGTTGSRIPDKSILENARIAKLSEVKITSNPIEAVKDADIIYTDVWASMGEKDKIAEREQMLRPFQINNQLLEHAKSDCIVMHCLPAERGKEITDEVIDGPHSVVFDEAENRLHIQKAIIAYLFGAKTF